MNITNTEIFDLSVATTYNLDFANLTQTLVIKGTNASVNVVGTTGTANEYTLIDIINTGTITGGGTLQIFGINIPSQLLAIAYKATALYYNGAWTIISIGSIDTAFIDNANIVSGANIDLNKLAPLSANRAVQTSAGGVLEASPTTTTDLAKLSAISVSAADLNRVGSTTALTADLNLLATLASAGLTTVQLSYLIGVTSPIQAQINAIAALVGPPFWEAGTGTSSLKDIRATTSSGNNGTAIGADAVNTGVSGQAIGAFAENNTGSLFSGQAIGLSAVNSGSNGQALGVQSVNRIDFSTNISGPIIIRKGDADGDISPYTFYAGAEVILMTSTFDAKTLGTQTIAFPSGVKMFVDEVGFIATSANTVSGQPSLSYGITGNTAALLATTPTTGITAAGDRDRRTTLVTSDGVTSLTVEVQVVATASTLQGRCYFKGFIVEDQ